MSYFRSYFEKNNTIIKNSSTNTAKNPTCEIFYGSSFSKFIFKLDLTDLKSKVDNGDYVLTTGTTHTLHLTNTIFGDETFLGADRGNGRERTSSFDLILFKIPESWDEGVGFDYEDVDFIGGEKTYDARPSNWYDRTTNNRWTIEGVYSNNPEILSTLHFDNGDEDINVDITAYVNDIINGGNDYGIGLAFPVNYQTISTEFDQSVSFFSMYTQTFFEPYIETFFDDVILDDRYDMATNDTQCLYLYVTKGSNFYDLDSLPVVDILDKSGTVITGLENLPTVKIRKGIYRVCVTINGALCPIKSFFFDKWKSLFINGVSITDVTQKFVLNPFDTLFSIGENNSDIKKYVVQYSGVKQNEKLKRGDIKKFIVNFRTINSPNVSFAFDDVYYRMYVKEGHTNVIVHDWTLMDKTNENSFFLDTTNYIPREYFIEIKGTINSEDIFYKEQIKFEIVSEKGATGVSTVVLPTPEPPMTFAILGDSGPGEPNTDTENVVNGIKSHTTDFIIHVGDANYGTPAEIYDNFLRFWPQEYLDKMYMAFGNHDLVTDYGSAFLDNLPLVNSLIGATKRTNNLLCYDFVRGPIHFFVLNSGDGDDELTEASDPNIQLALQFGEILPKMAESTSTWKILVVHKPPYTSETLHREGSTPLRLDYSALGVQVLLSGHSHDFEHIYYNSITYIVQGLGGAGNRCPVEPYMIGTEIAYCEKNGYTICTATESSLRFVTYSVDNDIIYDRTINR